MIMNAHARPAFAPPPAPGSHPKVTLLIESSRGYGRGLLRGIVRYAQLHGPWSFYIRPGDFEQTLPEMKLWGGAGIIARVESRPMAEAIAAADVPTVLVGIDPRLIHEVPGLERMSVVSSDCEGAARLAAAHFLERGFEYFGYVGVRGRTWSSRRSIAYCEAIRAAGFTPFVYDPSRIKRERSWEYEQPRLARWIEELPKPAALMACDDDRGRGVLEACRLAGVRVPEEVAVIGVDDDQLFCELADPPLSSVALNSEQGGYRTAHLLDQLMHAKISTPQHLIVEPTHVVTRRSSDVKAISGREVGIALSFIHRNRSRHFTVTDVAEVVGTSRRNLEMKFRKAVGRTILAEIQRVRLEHAKRMLRETDLPIPQIAESSGYNSVSYLTQVFRREVGVSPAKYRIRFRV
jgi:LacI family transcriptional regulator, galactose operon repressor